MEKMFDLPLVTDTYDSLTKVPISYLQPYMEKAGNLASNLPIDRAYSLKAGVESKVPTIIQTGYNSAKDQVVSVVASVDATLCSGVDHIVEKVPALKQATPDLYNSTVEGVGNYATTASTYLASFTIAHIVLKASDAGLGTADSMLKWASNEKVEPVMMGLRRIRNEATTMRKNGVERNGSEKSQVMEDASLAWAMVELVGLASYLSYFVKKTEDGGIEMVVKDEMVVED